jgi:hypothetical protein
MFRSATKRGVLLLFTVLLAAGSPSLTIYIKAPRPARDYSR